MQYFAPRTPPFKFDPTDDRCLQCCLSMALSARGITISDPELDALSQYEQGLNTQWSIACRGVAKYAPDVLLYSQLNFRAFAEEGGEYLRRTFDKQWFELQRSRSSPNFEKERQGAWQLVGSGLWVPAKLGPDDYEPKLTLLNELLEKRALIIASVNVRVLYDRNFDSSHAVFIYATDKPRWPQLASNVYLHDPSFTDGAGYCVPKEKVVRALRTHLLELDCK
jgi:hypothetical protein